MLPFSKGVFEQPARAKPAKNAASKLKHDGNFLKTNARGFLFAHSTSV
jgi:hypothetical protein